MGAPYAVKLDPDAARHYAEKGATILLLDVPEQTHVAFDHQVMPDRCFILDFSAARRHLRS